MKIIVKTLKGTHFQIEVKLEDKVSDVKKNIETVQGPDVYPAARQMLIHKGKVLSDDTTMEENEVSEDSFFVIMLSKNNNSSSAPPPTPAAPPPPPPSSTVTSPFNMDELHHALHSAYLDPERALEYFYNGILDDPPVLPPVAGAPPPPPPVNPPPPAPPSGPNANPPAYLNFLRDDPQFQAFRSRVRANPQILPPSIREFVSQNPQIVGMIRENQEEFLCMIFEPVEGEEDELGWSVFGGIVIEPPIVTREDMATFARLEGMGFNRRLVREVFLECDRNEEMAAHYLLDHVDEFHNMDEFRE